MNPSPPGYLFSTADIARAGLSPLELARLIVKETEGQPAGGNLTELENPIVVLLAEIAKSQRRSNARFNSSAWQLAAYSRVQILASNPLRTYFMVQNVGSGDLLVIFESGSTTTEDLSTPAASVAQLTTQQTRAVRVVAGGNYEPLVAPTNEVTIFTLNTATQGIIIEGA